MNKGRSPTRAVPPADGPTKESPRTVNNAVLRRHAVIRNQRGLHARAAAKFVKLVGQFDAYIQVSRAGQTVSGHSIMGLMMLAAGPGMDIEIAARGPAARAALDAIQALIESGFDERD
ncbi:MAG: HPr family phosphocarrier protein [Rhodospirillales bacterium]|nr:HPr family phosphocarrier protein [Rhodospirillales bacterium]MSP79689.1 HPr family phosphocarrier protein [Rhodospirillales bacterium]